MSKLTLKTEGPTTMWKPGLSPTAPTLMTLRMTLPDPETRMRMLSTGMERGMGASYVRLERMI